MATGIDISEFSGDIDFPKVRAAGHEFVIIRSSSGLVTVSPKARVQMALAISAGLQVIAGYHYLFSNLDGARQAEHAFETMTSLALPALVVDTEPRTKPIPSDGVHWVSPILVSFCLRFRELSGFWPTVYGGQSYLNAMKLPEVMANCPLWLPQWGSDPHGEPSPWTFHVLHQSAGNVAFGGGFADVNETRYSVDQLASALNGSAIWDPIFGTPEPPTKE